jgi:hypothetical protein
MEIKNLPKGSAAVFREKYYAANRELKYWNLLHYAHNSYFHKNPENLISYFSVLDIFKMSIFKKLAYFILAEYENNIINGPGYLKTSLPRFSASI